MAHGLTMDTEDKEPLCPSGAVRRRPGTPGSAVTLQPSNREGRQRRGGEGRGFAARSPHRPARGAAGCVGEQAVTWPLRGQEKPVRQGRLAGRRGRLADARHAVRSARLPTANPPAHLTGGDPPSHTTRPEASAQLSADPCRDYDGASEPPSSRACTRLTNWRSRTAFRARAPFPGRRRM